MRAQIAWFTAALGLWPCQRASAPTRRDVAARDVQRLDAGAGAQIDAFSTETETFLDASVDALADVQSTEADAAAVSVLTVRVVNASAKPMAVYVNPDVNEMLHARKLYSQRRTGAATVLAAEGELVKFFTVGQMPLCSTDGGVGYGGLGQPEQRPVAPGEAFTFEWDGRLRREVLDPKRGVCSEMAAPEPGRYRFEFDQPYGAPVCNRPGFVLPLAPDAPRVIEIRCVPRQRRPG